MRLVLIRHAESSANAEGRLQGRLDFGLSERGRHESERLAERVERLGVDVLYTSPLRRAFETAQAAAGRVGLEPIARPALMERDVGALAGLTREEILARFPDLGRRRAEGGPNGIPGFEADEAFADRVLPALQEIIELHPEQVVAAVTHGGVISAFVRHALRMPAIRPGPFAIDNASLTVLETLDGAPGEGANLRVAALNDTCHLEGL